MIKRQKGFSGLLLIAVAFLIGGAGASHVYAAPAPSAPTYTVTIDAYVDGQPATAASTGGAAFPMVANWWIKGTGNGTGDYTLSTTGYNSPNPYEAVTSVMTQGSSYNTAELGDQAPGNNGEVGDQAEACHSNVPFVYEGYTTGSSEAAAAAATPITTGRPTFQDLTSNEYVIIWNANCLQTPGRPISPNNNSSVSTSALNQISWGAVADPYGTVNYYYESSNSNAVNADGSFANPVYQSGALTSPSIDTAGTPPGTYYWHVMAKDSGGSTSAWSETYEVIVTS